MRAWNPTANQGRGRRETRRNDNRAETSANRPETRAPASARQRALGRWALGCILTQESKLAQRDRKSTGGAGCGPFAGGGGFPILVRPVMSRSGDRHCKRGFRVPVFEYLCHKCGQSFDLLVRTPRDEKHPTCPECGTPQVERKLSVFAARSGEQPSASLPRAGGCGRCGDPNGPCSTG